MGNDREFLIVIINDFIVLLQIRQNQNYSQGNVRQGKVIAIQVSL